VLINAGPDASILRALGSALSVWQRHVDAIVLTSDVRKYSGGLPDVEKRYDVGTIIRSSTRGERLALGGGVYLDTLWPPQTDAPMTSATGALVLRLAYGATSFLIQSDLPPRATDWLRALDANLPEPDVIISPSTPPGVYTSDGTAISTR
jgi:beta-lactamase superfamily II metal-dependent hydrolase